jgi:hypothetical protein
VAAPWGTAGRVERVVGGSTGSTEKWDPEFASRGREASLVAVPWGTARQVGRRVGSIVEELGEMVGAGDCSGTVGRREIGGSGELGEFVGARDYSAIGGIGPEVDRSTELTAAMRTEYRLSIVQDTGNRFELYLKAKNNYLGRKIRAGSGRAKELRRS